MDKIKMAVAALVVAASAAGCSYAGVAAAGDKVVIAKNNAFLFGVFNRVFVCKLTDAGVTDCQKSEAP